VVGVVFDIYTSVLTTSLASKDEEKTLCAIYPSQMLFGDVYLTISNKNRFHNSYSA